MPATVSSPAKRTNNWLRTTAPPVVKRNALKRARAPTFAIRVHRCNRAGAGPGQLDVVEMGLVAHRKLHGRVDLVGTLRGPFVAFHHHGARALLDHDQRAGEDRGRAQA